MGVLERYRILGVSLGAVDLGIVGVKPLDDPPGTMLANPYPPKITMMRGAAH